MMDIELPWYKRKTMIIGGIVIVLLIVLLVLIFSGFFTTDVFKITQASMAKSSYILDDQVNVDIELTGFLREDYKASITYDVYLKSKGQFYNDYYIDDASATIMDDSASIEYELDTEKLSSGDYELEFYIFDNYAKKKLKKKFDFELNDPASIDATKIEVKVPTGLKSFDGGSDDIELFINIRGFEHAAGDMFEADFVEGLELVDASGNVVESNANYFTFKETYPEKKEYFQSYVRIPVNSLKPGKYTFNIMLNDNIADAKRMRSKTFEIK